jgi:hypothetical protein
MAKADGAKAQVAKANAKTETLKRAGIGGSFVLGVGG